MAVQLSVHCKDGISGAEKLIAKKAAECTSIRYQKAILQKRIAELEKDLTASKNLLEETNRKFDFLTGDLERLIGDLWIEKVESKD